MLTFLRINFSARKPAQSIRIELILDILQAKLHQFLSSVPYTKSSYQFRCLKKHFSHHQLQIPESVLQVSFVIDFNVQYEKGFILLKKFFDFKFKYLIDHFILKISERLFNRV